MNITRFNRETKELKRTYLGLKISSWKTRAVFALERHEQFLKGASSSWSRMWLSSLSLQVFISNFKTKVESNSESLSDLVNKQSHRLAHALHKFSSQQLSVKTRSHKPVKLELESFHFLCTINLLHRPCQRPPITDNQSENSYPQLSLSMHEWSHKDFLAFQGENHFFSPHCCCPDVISATLSETSLSCQGETYSRIGVTMPTLSQCMSDRTETSLSCQGET